MIFKILANYGPLLLAAMGQTLLLALWSLFFACLIGLFVGILSVLKSRVCNIIATIFVDIIRGVPMIVLAFFVYFGVPMLMNDNLNWTAMTGSKFTFTALQAGIICLSLNCGAYMAEIVRGGIISIDRGQFEGAMSIGMTHAQTMFKVIIPQVMRNILPSVSNEFVINIKDTSVLNVIGVTELYYFAGIIKRQNFQTFQTYLVVCILYFILTFTVTRLLRWVERKLDGNENYTIFGSQTDVNAEIHITKEG